MSSTAAALAVVEPKPDLKPLRIFELIKNAQQKHGLRHENYQRYRGYCGRRVERIRKSLKFTNQYKCLPKRPGKFVARTVQPENCGDIRYLEMLVFELERNWAYAMECKFESIDQPLSRKKFVMRQKLRKAAKWADFLETLLNGNELVQDITKMEAKAHCAFIRASLALELKQWKSAAEHFDGARSNYAKLCEDVKGTGIYEIYMNKLREMEKLLKLCRNESGDELLSAVNSINLNVSDMDESQRQIPMEIEETTKPVAESKKPSRKERKIKARKEAKPFKPFFFDLALNFVKKPQSTSAS